MRRTGSWVLVAATALLVGSVVAAAAIPGPQRMMAPGLFGFEEIAPNIYAPENMALSRKQAVLQDIKLAKITVSRFFERTTEIPRVILWPAATCDRPFGKKSARGVAYGAHIIRLNEGGLSEMIATHELSHVALKRRAGYWQSFIGRVPAWFDEGMATFISGDERYEKSYPASVREDLQSAGPWWNWGDIIARHGWKPAYGESRNMVRNLFQEIGREGLMEILDRVADGEDFAAALETVRAG